MIDKKYSKIEHILVFTFMLYVLLSIIIEYFELEKGILYSSFKVDLVSYAYLASVFILIGFLTAISVYTFRYTTDKKKLYIYLPTLFLFISGEISQNYLEKEDANMRINGLISIFEISKTVQDIPDSIDKNSSVYKDIQAMYLESKQLEMSNKIEFNRIIKALEEKVKTSTVMIDTWIVYMLLIFMFSLFIPQHKKIDEWIE